MAHPSIESVRQALAQVAHDATALDVYGSDAVEPPQLPSVGQRRRATRRGAPDPVQRASLYLNAEGVLEWQLDAAIDVGSTGLRRSARRTMVDLDPEPPDGELVDVFEFETLPVNAVGAFLERVDARLNPRLRQQQGRLWRLIPGAHGQVQPQALALGTPPSGKSRRLLFVHGTFSQSQAFFDGMAAADNGAAFMARMFQAYDEVLAFEHPTLSVSPLMNALDLQRELAAIRGPLDIVAHSRGGLLVRWAIEAVGLPAQPVRVVLVGSPLGGTSLASPPRLKATLGLLSNFGSAVMAAGGLASAYAPLMLVPLALVKVASSMAAAAAQTPVLDGAIQLVPGLAAQSRVANNPELSRLRLLPRRPQVDYYAVTSNFEPEDPGWKFWQWFRGKRLAHAAADKVFPGANDLVVDTESMTELPAALAGARHFGRNARVHHTNYFEQTQTLKFIADSLGWA
jgi:hypothetical protein